MIQIFDRTIEQNGLKQAAQEEGKGIIAFSPLAQGMLTDRYLNGIPADSRVMVKTFEKEYGKGEKWNLTLILSDNSGKCMAKNTYQDICTLLSRVDGHPDRMSHEFGMRLYWA